MRPSWMLFLKRSLTEQPARPEEAQAQAQAQEEAQAQDDAQDDAHEERCEDPCGLVEERGLPVGTLTTFTRMKVFGESPYR